MKTILCWASLTLKVSPWETPLMKLRKSANIRPAAMTHPVPPRFLKFFSPHYPRQLIRTNYKKAENRLLCFFSSSCSLFNRHHHRRHCHHRRHRHHHRHHHRRHLPSSSPAHGLLSEAWILLMHPLCFHPEVPSVLSAKAE